MRPGWDGSSPFPSTSYLNGSLSVICKNNESSRYSKTKGLLELVHRVLGTLDGVTDSPGIGVDLVIIASDEALITEEVDFRVFGTGDVLLGLDVPQAVGLVPTSREHVERDLTPNRETRFDEMVRALVVGSRRAADTYVRP